MKEFPGLVLDDQVLDHLATPEGAMALWRERVNPELISESNDGIRDALAFVYEYIDQYNEAPDIAILSEETGYDQFEDPIAPIEYVIDELRERNIRQQLKKTVTKIGRMASSPQEALHLGFSEFSRTIGETTSHRDILDTKNLGLVKERYLDRKENGVIGATFGFAEMDDAFGGGLQVGRLVFYIARPKRFKTWLLLKSACTTFENGHNVDVFTLEMSPEEIQDRAACMLAGLSWSLFEARMLSEEHLAILDDCKDWMAEQPMKMNFYRPPIGERTVAQLRQTAQENGSVALYIDQLSKLESTRHFDQRWLEIASICIDLKQAAASFPVVCAAQFNREAIAVKSVMDMDLANIGLSDAVGQEGDLLLGVYQNKEMKDSKLFHFGTIETRSFENHCWEIRNELGLNSNFRVVEELELDD